MASDARNRFEDDVFEYRETKNGQVFISSGGRVVTTLRGKAAEKFLSRISGLDRREQQHVMARTTGHYKHGNER